MAIETEVGALLSDRGLTLVTAESSTGGLRGPSHHQCLGQFGLLSGWLCHLRQ